MPSKDNLQIYQGDDYNAVVTISGSGTPPNLTGYIAQAQIRVGPADTNPQVVVEITTAVILPNFVSLSIPAAVTVGLSGLYVWDLQLVSSAGMITTVLAGGVVVTAEVTRRQPVQQFSATLNPGTPVPGPPGPAGPAGPAGAPGVQISQQRDVTASRSLGSIYQNPSGTLPLFVLITWNLVGKGNAVAAQCDATSAPSLVVAEAIDPSNSGGISVPMFFIVPPGYFYACIANNGTPTAMHWIEYQ